MAVEKNTIYLAVAAFVCFVVASGILATVTGSSGGASTSSNTSTRVYSETDGEVVTEREHEDRVATKQKSQMAKIVVALVFMAAGGVLGFKAWGSISRPVGKGLRVGSS